MLIAQITDLHLGFGSGGDFEDNAKRLRLAVKTLNELVPRPDLLLCTGDLTDHGDLPSYRRLKKILDKLAMPVLFCMGNHDNRDAFRQVYPNAPFSGGYNQYAVDNLPLRILVLDTLEVGRHGGGFDEARAAWLEARLAEAADRPTLVVMHHPPIDTGIEWMSIGPTEAWVARFEAVVARYRNIVAILAGHVHRPIIAAFANTTVRVCPSTQPQVVLDLDPIDLERPDDRPMIVAGPPGIGLHWWNGKALVSHYTDTNEQTRAKILARYTVKMQGFLKHLAHERAEGSAPTAGAPTPSSVKEKTVAGLVDEAAFQDMVREYGENSVNAMRYLACRLDELRARLATGGTLTLFDPAHQTQLTISTVGQLAGWAERYFPEAWNFPAALR